MKTLKFMSNLSTMILNGEKTSTWRLFDDKDLRVGDELGFIVKETGEHFGTGEILRLKKTTLGDLEAVDWKGHEKYSSEEEMYKTYRSYCGDQVGPKTEIKIVHFSFEST